MTKAIDVISLDTNLDSETKLQKSNSVLSMAVRCWFLVAVIGQWIFVVYIATLFGGSALRGDFEKWNSHLPQGLIAGDYIGNFFLFAHLLLAAIITFLGPLQLIPQIRSWMPQFHRYSGRLYVISALIISVAGLYLVWAPREVLGGLFNSIAISINAVLIILCAGMAWRYALARKFDVHRRWALRLFIVVSGVWFFRIILMLSFLLFSGTPPGSTENLDGPFDSFMSFASYLLPLIILELYFYTRQRAGSSGRYAMAGSLAVLSIAMAVGIFMATAYMWLPGI